MKFIKIINEDYYDRNLLKTSGMKPIVDAIQNRRPITFMYTGPIKGPEKVKRGVRQNVEPVALGLTKKNKLAIRAWVPTPNNSKKGLEKNQWRTFLLSRMNNIRIDTSKNYEGPKPGFNDQESIDRAFWPLIKIYVATDFSTEPKPAKKVTKPKPAKKAEPVPAEPEVTPPTEPSPEVQPEKPEVQPQKPEVEPKATELPQPKPKEKPSVNPPRVTQPTTPETEPEKPEEEKPEDEENKELQESVRRIKSLMLLIN
jgi:WYL domain